MGVLIRIDVETNFGLCGVFAGEGFVGTSLFTMCGGSLGKIVFGKAWVSLELNDVFRGQGGADECEVIWANVSISVKPIEIFFECLF